MHGLNKKTSRSNDWVSARLAGNFHNYLSITATCLEWFTRSRSYETERNRHSRDMLLFGAMFLCWSPFIVLLDQHDRQLTKQGAFVRLCHYVCTDFISGLLEQGAFVQSFSSPPLLMRPLTHMRNMYASLSCRFASTDSLPASQRVLPFIQSSQTITYNYYKPCTSPPSSSSPWPP